MSFYLKAHRQEYYDRLDAIRRDGDWEGWLRFFLQGIFEVSQEATNTAREILALREGHRQALGGSANGLRLLDFLFEHPIVTVRMVEKGVGCAYATANKLVEEFESAGILREITGWQRNRRYEFEPYLALFRGPQPAGE